jgi:hypothetical protein
MKIKKLEHYFLLYSIYYDNFHKYLCSYKTKLNEDVEQQLQLQLHSQWLSFA